MLYDKLLNSMNLESNGELLHDNLFMTEFMSICKRHTHPSFYKEYDDIKEHIAFSIVECATNTLRLTLLFKEYGMKQTLIIQKSDKRCVIHSSKSFAFQAYKHPLQSVMYNMDALVNSLEVESALDILMRE